MTLKDAALKVAVLTALRDAIAAEQEIARTEALIAMTDAADTLGVQNIAVLLPPDDTKVATLSLSGGELKPRITDNAAFTAWVKANHPTEIETVECIRGAYVTAILKNDGVDKATGEIAPGIELRPSPRGIRLLFVGDGRDAVAAAWRRGELENVALPAVTA